MSDALRRRARTAALEESGGDQEYAEPAGAAPVPDPRGPLGRPAALRNTNVGQAIQARDAGDREGQPRARCTGSSATCSGRTSARLSDELLVDLDRPLQPACRPSATPHVPNDVLGDAYEYLIKKFADLTNRKAGEF
ncbi:MAG: N-6 DNA methylase [Ilumatobacteraceae bacterium]